MTIAMSLKTCRQFLNIALKQKSGEYSTMKWEYRVAAPINLHLTFIIIRKSNLDHIKRTMCYNQIELPQKYIGGSTLDNLKINLLY